MSYLKDLVTPQIWSVFLDRAKDTVDERLAIAEHLHKNADKSPGRALADALTSPLRTEKVKKPKTIEEANREIYQS